MLALGLGAILAQAAAPPTPQGFITEKVWLDIGGGTAVTDLTGNTRFPNSPDITSYRSFFELYGGDDINTGAPGDLYNNAGSQLIGYFYPETTGDYIFYVCSDDGGNLYLSTDGDPANKKLIAQEAGWSGVRNYSGIGGGSTVEAKCSLTFTGTQWPTKAPEGGAKITLTAGRAYYIEALAKEGGGGENLSASLDGVLPIPGSMLSTFDKSNGPLTIKTQPQSVTLNEGAPASFSVVVDGTPPYAYQWKKDGTDIADATRASYSIARVSRTDNGAKFTVAITGGQGSLTSAQAALTVNFDATAPTIVSASSSATFDTVRVVFSEPMDPTSAAVASNYKIDNGVTVTAAALAGAPGSALDNTVVLTTSKQPSGSTFTLTVNGVKDAPGNTIAANSTATFRSFVFTTGWCTYERWDGDTKALAAFETALADGSQGPAGVAAAQPQFDGPWGVGDNYNSRKFTWFVAPFTGNYVFFVSADDGANLYISTDENPANKKLAAQEGSWSNQYQWTVVGSGDVALKRSDQCSASEWGNVITLTKGNRYYIELTHHEGSGGDGAGATFIKEGDPDPATSAAGMFLQGAAIGTYLDPAGAAINITQEPASQTGVDGKIAIFKVVATGASLYGNTVGYQWQKAAPGSSTFTDIAGATTAIYKTPLLTLADSGAKYRVKCSVPTLDKTSAEAVLTVVADTFPPVPSVGTIKTAAGAVQVGVGFDEDVNAAGLVAGNFSIAGATVSKFTLVKNSFGDYNAALLDVTGVAPGTSYTLNVKNVADLKGNAIPAAGANVSFQLGLVEWAETGTPSAKGQVVPVAKDGFDVLNGGRAEWGSYDEVTIGYLKKTNDFDVKVRVMYAEPSSQWARAGLMARNDLNINENPEDRNGNSSASAYAQTHVNPSQTLGSSGRWEAKYPGDPAVPANQTPNNGHEQNQRLTKGGATSGWGSPSTPPTYPDAWLRLARVGASLYGYRSEDGVTWTAQGSTTLTDQQAEMYVGVFYATEAGNIWGSGDHDVWGAYDAKFDMIYVTQFRDFGDFASAVTPTLGIAKDGTGKVTITYTGTLQSAATVNGPYTDVAGAASPYTPAATGYFRARQ